MRPTLLERMRKRDEANATAGARETAWAVIRDNIDGSKPRRFIAGTAVGSPAKDMKGQSICARGVEFALPALLLAEHSLFAPLGRVFKVEAKWNSLHFEAEIINSGRIPAAESMWEHICAKRLRGASVGVFSQVEVLDGEFNLSDLDEISVVENAAGLGAAITRVWTRDPVVRLDGRSSITEIWRA